MKRITVLLLCLALVFCACGRAADEPETTQKTETEPIAEESEELFAASWLSYMELAVTESRSTEEEYKSYIDGILDNMKSVSITDVFVHVRPFADAFYQSELFPTSAYVSSEQGEKAPFDVLQTVIECAKEKGMKVHAWINPYRVSGDSDISSLCESNIARQWYEQGRTDCTALTDKGIYFNPASLEVQKLIIDGVSEILENYDVQGIHIDDYFYFENCGDFDKEQYEAYLSKGGRLDLSSWRRENVSSLVSSLYITVKSFGEDKLFSVSPSGDIDKCTDEYFADVTLWCREKGYCDMIIPQLYYGFENGNMPFEACLSDWCELTEESNVRLVVGLALYKVGQEDKYALGGKNEWTENNDIISRQVSSIKRAGCDGFALYSGTYINFSETFLSEELNNLKSVL